MGRSGEGREGDGGGLGWGGVWAGHVFFHVCFRSPSRRHDFSTFSDTFVSPFFHLFFTSISRFFHVLRRLYGHVFFTFFSRFP